MVRTARVVAVVGAGAAGAAVAARLLESRPAPRVVLIDPAQADGRGVAYRTEDPRHLLNVPAGRMSARVDDPEDFVRWLRSGPLPDADGATFAPRREFGRYLAEHLRSAGTVRRITDRVIGIDRGAPGPTLHLGATAPLPVDAVVLATGVLAPRTGWAPAGLLSSDRFVADPWASGALSRVPDDADVLLVGTGLTMVDVASTLDRPGRTVHAVSRSGRLPRRHSPGHSPLAPTELPVGRGLDELRRAVRTHLTRALREHGDWRSGMDGLRPHLQRMWLGLDDADRARFLAEDVRAWDVLRHRMPPASADDLAARRRERRLTVGRAEVLDVRCDDAGLDVHLSDGRCLRVGAVVNCTGPEPDPAGGGDPLADRLLRSGLARRGPLAMGYDTTDDGRLLGATGDHDASVWTLGSTRRGTLWESTAFPEIRGQAVDVAAAVTAHLARPVTHHRPRDRYGLPLTTSRAAADTFDRALGAILDVRSGAEQGVVDAVGIDPGFAVGHATLAVFAHEGDRAAEARAHLRRAVAAAATGGDDRERGFVQAVSCMIGGCDPGALVRHLDAWPRDALAASIAVPTIAFSGVSAGRDSWEIVERLAPAYGDDPWYLAQLAFVRQDQARWDEAERLSARALTGAPACGHAVHARTHVFYETGAHEAGLAWLTAWLAEHGPQANHRAHFSWHAALHELALCDDDAVRRRYAAELAPPAVHGPRALVDSASLLWRCRMTRHWTDAPSVEPVLESVPAAWLTAPPTSFAALHAALALAAAADLAGLERLRRYAAGRGAPCFTGVVAPLCGAFTDVVQSRWAAAADGLRAIMPRLVECGGSAAQREVVEDTLIHCLTAAGRSDQAGVLLNGRLDRRPSRLDTDRLGALAG